MRRTLLLYTALLVVSAQSVTADIQIGTVGPVTGQYAEFGEQMARGAAMAVKDINEAGGIGGERLVLAVVDDACDPRQAVIAAEAMVSAGAVFVAGHFCSKASIPASAVYAENEILQMSPASTEPALTENAAAQGWTTIMRICGRDDEQGKAAGAMLADRYAERRIAIIHDDTAYGIDLATAAKQALNQRGIFESVFADYATGAADFLTLVDKLIAAEIGVVFIGGHPIDIARIIRTARDGGFRPKLVGGDALIADEFWRIADGAGEGAIFTFEPAPRQSPAANELVERFRAEGYEPAGFTLYTYAAVEAWAKAANATGSINATAVAERLKSGETISTVIGEVAFDAKGDVIGPHYVWYAWHHGAVVSCNGRDSLCH